MPKELHLLSRRRRQQLINLEIARYNQVECEDSVDTVNFNEVLHPSAEAENFGRPQSPDSIVIESDLEITPCNDDYDLDSEDDGDIRDIGDDTDAPKDNNMFDNLDRDNETNSNRNLKDDLRDWVSKYNVSHTVVSAMLTVWRKYGHDVPKDARTLMKTPRLTSSQIIPMDGGQYAHFGLSAGIKYSLKAYFTISPDQVKFDINVDGLPLAKSSSSQFWPIMASVVTDCYTDPFVVGIYHGMKKPDNVNTFLRPFVDELKHLQQEGLSVEDKKISVTLNAIIADAPAKAFITQVKGHTGYFGCSKCIQEGDFVENRVTFPEINYTSRTDESFRLRQQPEHHIGSSCLEELNIGMVSQVPHDYGHLVCLGVVKRIVQFWVKGKRNVRVRADKLNSISEALISLRPFITSEFARDPRSLHDIDRWKATELRQFLLYTGPVVLRGLLPQEFYTHFLAFSIAIRILADTELYATMIDYAQSLLTWFVSMYGSLYGYQFLSYNVHNLLHLCDDVRKFGPVDTFSSFKYENNMQKIKNKIRAASRPLEQIVNRITEQNQFRVISPCRQKYPVTHYDKSPNNQASLPVDSETIRALEFRTFILKKRGNENCCMLNNGDVIIIHDIYEENLSIFVKAKRFLSGQYLYNSPCDSRNLGISIVSNENLSEFIEVPVAEIKKKCLIIKSGRDNECNIIIPLLHYNN